MTTLADNALIWLKSLKNTLTNNKERYLWNFKSLFTLGSVLSRRKSQLKKRRGPMLEQHIRDAKGELDKAGKSRVTCWRA